MSVTALRGAIGRLAALPAAERDAVIRELPVPVARTLHDCWAAWAHAGQLPGCEAWDVWLIRAGRGFGKTRAGAEWVHDYARAHADARIALVGATVDDVRKVMVEGAAGLLATAWHGEACEWRADAGVLTFASGARAFVYSAAAPEKLRGPEHDAAWCDELGKWPCGDAAWDNLVLGLRRGDRPQALVTTTPRATVLMRRVMALRGLVETRGATADNPHLAAAFQARMEAQYGAGRLGRQELAGELVDDLDGALWTRALLDECRVEAAPALERVLIGVDPPAGREGDACGIVAVGRASDGRGYVIEDASVVGLAPEGWAHAVAACAARHGADRVVAERNQGGDMVESVLRAAMPNLPLRTVHAVQAKGARAEPVSMLYHAGRMSHVGGPRALEALEDQLCGMKVEGYRGPGRSPDRADALVWATAVLMLGQGDGGRAGMRPL